MYLSDIDGIAKKSRGMYARKEIYTVNDLVKFFPRKYTDYRKLSELNPDVIDRHAAVKGKLTYCDLKTTAIGKPYILMYVKCSEDLSFSVFLFSGQHMYERYLQLRGTEVVVCGKVSYTEAHGYSMPSPDVVCAAEDFKPAIMGVYSQIAGISDESIKRHIQMCLPRVTEPLEEAVLEKYQLMDYPNAIKGLHEPESETAYRACKYRMVFNDLLYFAWALGIAENKGAVTSEVQFKKRNLVDQYHESLPFSLTRDQKECIDQFINCAKVKLRNNILLQGDVGCGKTVVAISLALCACENGYQAVMVAPREVLARQHFNEISNVCESLSVNCVFLHSDMKQKERKQALSDIQSGKAKIIVGTHSCMSDNVVYNKLGLIITDEEHLFGVKQKESLNGRAEEGVHILSMSATPIPRSLASVLYGSNKKIAVIKTMPNGRKPIQTAVLHKRDKALEFTYQQIQAGHQCYVVCPAIEENEKVQMTSIESVEKSYREFFEPKGICIGIVNGKLSAEEKDVVINDFVQNRIQVLISTTVIEVGVNVPNATVMIVEQAERFGLATLHQLRGRVGRSNLQSYCILLSEERNNQRLNTMVQTTDGFKIAEADLLQRGSGDLIGLKQAGRNEYVNELLAYPKVFERAIEAARFCKENDYGRELMDLYIEHELAES